MDDTSVTPIPRPKGLSCPACGGQDLRVLDTVKPTVGVVRRYRQCGRCGMRVRSRETLISTVTVELAGEQRPA